MIAGPMPRFLASVRDVDEALIAARLGADIIDLKDPHQGALGAIAEQEQRAILAALGRKRPPVSATVGDLPFEPDVLVPAIRRTADAGVDLVKFGIFATGAKALAGLGALDRALRHSPPARPLVALFLAELIGDGEQAAVLAATALRVTGIAGVMLDTAGKTAGSLPDMLSFNDLAGFVAAAHRAQGFAGLAGSLAADHVSQLANTGADVLGFRGALCGGDRKGSLSVAAFARVRGQIDAARAARSAAALPA